MVLIIGGAYQGKLEFAEKHYLQQDIINEFHLWVLDKINKNIDPMEYLKDNIERYKDNIIICDDISCGIVPMDKNDRLWREYTSRCCCILTKEAKEVYRVFCGIATKIK